MSVNDQVTETSRSFTIGQVARATGLSTHTLRIWEHRYGAPKTVRLPSGHRRYMPEEVRRLRYVCALLEQGYRPGELLRRSAKEISEMVGASPTGRDLKTLEQWIEYTKTHQENEFRSSLKREYATLGPYQFVVKRMVPFVHRVGEAWAHGEISITQEHFASEVVGDFLNQSWRLQNSEALGEAFVLAGLDDEKHDLALRMCATILTSIGRKVVYLGKNTPIASISEAVKHHRAYGVCLSFSACYDKKEGARQVRDLRTLLGPDALILTGGRGAPEGEKRFDSFTSFFEWLTHTKE